MEKELYADYLEEMEEEKKNKDPKRKFGCSYCGFKALTSLGLTKHLNKEHPYKD